MVYHPFRNLGLKVLSVGLATLLWLAVIGEHVVERGLRVALEFQNIPPSLEIIGDPPNAVDVRVRGASGLLSRLQPGEIVAILDLGNARPGSRLFHLRTDQVRVPFGVEVAQVVPATVAIELERSGRRVVPVVPAVEGQPAPGFVAGRVTSDPATVEVVGPESHLRQVASATTETVSIDGASQTVKDVVTVGVMDASLRLSEPRSSAVQIEILPAPVARDLRDVPVRLRNVGPGQRAQVVPPTVTVAVRGERAALERLTAEGVTAFIDLAGLGPGQYNLPIHVDPPRAFGVDDIRPATAAVRIR
jgi:YbbR domain-containing protein